MSKQVQVTFHQGVHSCDLRFTRDYVGKSLLICLLILDLSSSSSDLQLMCEGLRDKSLSSVKVLKDVYTYCDLSKQFTDPSLKRWNFCDWYKLDTKSEWLYTEHVDETGDRDGNQGDGDYERQDGKVKLQWGHHMWPVSFSGMRWRVCLCKNLRGAAHVIS